MINSDVIVAGAGLAGLSASLALASDGARVTLLERRPEIGGRAYSYLHPSLRETIDSQHVLLGCCTNLLDLCKQAGTDNLIRWYDELVFLETNGSRSRLRPGVLPAPLHQTIDFLRAPMLTLHDKAVIALGLMRFINGYSGSDSDSFASWIRRTGQTDRAIRHFWEPVIWGALNDTLDRCSTKYAGKVFHESFLRSPYAGRLGIPTLPLTDFFSPVARFAEKSGVRIERRAGVDAIAQEADGRWTVSFGDRRMTGAKLIVALDYSQTTALLATLPNAPPPPERSPFTAAPITTVHLWFDRDVTAMDHAVLLDTRIQWMFSKSRIRHWAPESGTYLELVISASWPELTLGRQEILDAALSELALFFPATKDAKLLKSSVLKEARATFSVAPDLDRHRPAQVTQWPGLYVAGDWTATDWPSTMESAVRSGRLAAGSVLGNRERFLTPELPATGLMRWLTAS